MKKYIIIVAGGKGLRMGTEIPKQFIEVCGIPVLMRTISAFYNYDSSFDIILVLPIAQQDYWKNLCLKHKFNIPYRLADGGDTRYHSVKNGIALVEGEGLIGVHDGVRPFVSEEVIGRCYDEAAEVGAAVPVIDVVETVRHITSVGSETVPRNEYKLVQTPQVFRSNLLKHAYNQSYSSLFTDDASVVEALGEKISLVEGNRENIKLTTPFDLKMAELLCQENNV